jgi:hypothetical protein
MGRYRMMEKTLILALTKPMRQWRVQQGYDPVSPSALVAFSRALTRDDSFSDSWISFSA